MRMTDMNGNAVANSAVNIQAVRSFVLFFMEKKSLFGRHGSL